MAVSPLSNNTLFLPYLKNPFPTFFRRGLNVSLSTDDPLQFHHTQEPLIEEYSVASKLWKLSAVDMCEIARNSVLQSGYDHATKVKWLGEHFFLNSRKGNQPDKTHLPHLRIDYRYKTYKDEIGYLENLSGKKNAFVRGMLSREQEKAIMNEMKSRAMDERQPFSKAGHQPSRVVASSSGMMMDAISSATSEGDGASECSSMSTGSGLPFLTSSSFPSTPNPPTNSITRWPKQHTSSTPPAITTDEIEDEKVTEREAELMAIIADLEHKLHLQQTINQLETRHDDGNNSYTPSAPNPIPQQGPATTGARRASKHGTEDPLGQSSSSFGTTQKSQRFSVWSWKKGSSSINSPQADKKNTQSGTGVCAIM
eukprot:TRINITY_DN75824_c0_g1_i1.p1 TRINITY_DN75824_c0_g1~~TRINITY_DN75824_c0_g1_i1.p1  ORF type:complete len:379 (-),score=39.85 TRINITY_DN75824_c0_g1_i1:39-1142(-)